MAEALNHVGTAWIDLGAIVLRRFEACDAAFAFEHWAGDWEVVKYLSWGPHKTIEETRAMIEGWVQSYERRDFYRWAIALSDTNEAIGSIGTHQVREKNQMAEASYFLGRAWWNKGYMSLALKAEIAYFFERVRVNRVQACHDARNIASGRVMEKAGMVFEGTLRAYGTSNLGINDESYWSILASEYFARRGD